MNCRGRCAGRAWARRAGSAGRRRRTSWRRVARNPTGVAGWNRAYRRYTANVNRQTGEVIPAYEPVVVANETRPSRTNLEVATLPVQGWLVEIEVVAAYTGR